MSLKSFVDIFHFGGKVTCDREKPLPWEEDSQLISNLSKFDAGQSSSHAVSDAIKRGDLNALISYFKDTDLVDEPDDFGNTPLLVSVVHNRCDIAEWLLTKGANVNVCDPNGNSALMIASLQQNKDLVKILIDADAGINLQNQQGHNALMVFAHYGDIDITKLLFCKGAMLNVQSKLGVTALMFATANRKHVLVSFLVKHADSNLADNDGNTALAISAKLGDEYTLKLLVKHSRAIDKETNQGKTALMIAAEDGHFPIVEYLVKNGALVEKCMANGKKAANLAYINKHYSVAKFLGKADAEESDDIIETDAVKIILAAYNGDQKGVVEQINMSVDVNMTDQLGRTALMAASQTGHKDIVVKLINNKARVDQASHLGMTALGYAVMFNHKSVQDFLVQEGANIDIENIHGRTIFLNCVASGSLDLVRSVDLLGCNIFDTDKMGKNALMLAAEGGFLNIAQYLISQGFSKDKTSSENLTAVQYAFINEHADVNRYLEGCFLEGENEINQKQELLQYAEQGNHSKLTNLLSKGCFVDYMNEAGITPLFFAAHNGHILVVRALIKHGAVVNRRIHRRGQVISPLIAAVAKGHGDIVNLLLQEGAIVNIKTIDGNTPLMFAVSEMYVDIARSLLENGARVNACDKDGDSVLSFATRGESYEVVRLLFEHGAKANIANNDGNTPLHFAAIEGSLDIVKLLIANHANVNSVDKTGKTALVIAAQNDKDEVARYLISQGANNDFMPMPSSQLNQLMLLQSQLLQSMSGELNIDMEDFERFRRTLESNSGNSPEISVQKRHNEPTPYANQEGDRIIEPGNIVTGFGEDAHQSSTGSSTEVVNTFFSLCNNLPFDKNKIEKILNNGFDINSIDQDGHSALLIAVKNKHGIFAEWLINKGADANCQDSEGLSPLMHVCKFGDQIMINLLLKNNANIELCDTKYHTALHHAIKHNKASAANILLRNNANVDHQDQNGVSALMLASSQHNTNLMKLLLKHQASVNMKDNKGRSALSYCALEDPMQPVESVRCLNQPDGIIDNTDEDGNTPLILSIISKNLFVAKELMSCGANINHVNMTGQSVFMIAATRHSMELLKFMLEYREQINNDSKISVMQFYIFNSQMEEALLLIGHKKQFMNTEYLEDILATSIINQNNMQQCLSIQKLMLLDGSINKGKVLCQRSNVTIDTVTELFEHHFLSDSYDDTLTASIITLVHGYYEQATRILAPTTLSSDVGQGEMHSSLQSMLCIMLCESESDTTRKRCKCEITSIGKGPRIKDPQAEDQLLCVGDQATIMDTLRIELNEIQQVNEISEEMLKTEELVHQHNCQMDAVINLQLLKIDEELEKILLQNDMLKKEIHPEPTSVDSVANKSDVNYLQWQFCQCWREGCKQCDFEKEASSVYRQSNGILFLKLPEDQVKTDKAGEKVPPQTVNQPRYNGETNPGYEAQLATFIPANMAQKPRENIRQVSVIPHNDKPYPKMHLFKLHATVSQCSIDGRQMPSNACAIIAMLFAHRFIRRPTVISAVPSPTDIPDLVFQYAVAAMREGNQLHELNYEGEPIDLGPDEVSLLANHLGVKLIKETDVDTREPETLVDHVLNLRPNQIILFIKNVKVVSIFPCNLNKWLLLFDSHPHNSGNTTCGAYLFFAKKDKKTIENLFRSYDTLCDLRPFYGKFAIFQIC